jgi:prepilin-type N-terminal cleavage/methylation domain-containing protein/prepilin-type processing-associated H-X9-DG protein
MQSKRNPASHAFTLLELLLAIAIAAILATLLGTGAAKAKTRGRSIQCANNLKQHGIAIHSFVQQHSVYPLILNPGYKLGIEPDHYGNIWAALAPHGLGPHTSKTPSVHACPSATFQISPQTNGSRSITGYGYNVHGLGQQHKDEPLGLAGRIQVGSYIIGPVPESAIANPSGLIAMGDGVRGWNKTYEDGVAFLARTPDAALYGGSEERVPARHQGRLLILFADGHVSAVPLTRLFEDRSDEALASWNRDGLPHRERLN